MTGERSKLTDICDGFFNFQFRFCVAQNNSIDLYATFPGHGIQLATMDPTFQMTSTSIGKNAWFDVQLEMNILERLPKTNFECSQHSFDSLSELKNIQEKHELCILNGFMTNFEKRNKTCHPFFLSNYPHL